MYLLWKRIRWMYLNLADDRSTLVQVMAWCHQATSHYLNQCWPRSMSPYGVTRPHLVKEVTYPFILIFPHLNLCISTHIYLIMQWTPTLYEASFQAGCSVWPLSSTGFIRQTISWHQYINLISFPGELLLGKNPHISVSLPWIELMQERCNSDTKLTFCVFQDFTLSCALL